MKKRQNDSADDLQKESRAAARPGHKTSIGGQALIEGLMMIGPTRKAMAVRKADGAILLEQMAAPRFTGAANTPFLRGCVRLFQQLVSGTRALIRSAELVEETTPAGDDAQADEGEKTPEARPSIWKRLGQRLDAFFERHADQMLYVSAIFGILFSVGLFILLPNFLTSFVQQLVGLDREQGAGHVILLNLIEGVIRIVIFISYLALASRMKDIRRVWMYHGAEHKTIACYEDNQTLTVDNVRNYSRFHPRCGTAFMFIVIIVSIIVFSFAGWWGRWLNLLIRFALVPLVAGIAYEIIRLAGRYENVFTRLVSAPGLWLQRLTTAEPDDSILEVAITAMNAVIPDEPKSDRW